MKNQTTRLFYLVFTFLISTSVFAQKAATSEADLKKQADRSFESGNYSEALAPYSQLLSLYPRNSVYNFRYGVSLLEAGKVKASAATYLEIACRDPKIPDDVWHHLGRSYMIIGNYTEACNAFEKFKKVASPSKVKKFETDNYIENCKTARMLLRSRKNIVILSSTEVAQNSFYLFYHTGEERGKLVPAADQFLTPLDKDRQKDPLMFISEDKQMIVLASYGKKNERGKDLYIVNRQASGEWSAPQYLGDVINTPEDEDYAYLDNAGTTLYFSSKGHQTLGGFDIFKSEYNALTGTWSQPVNIGIPINTIGDDIYYVPGKDGESATYATTIEAGQNSIAIRKIRHGAGAGQVLITGTYMPQDQKLRRDARITILNKDGKGVLTSVYTDPTTGKYELVVPPGEDYLLVVEGGGYLPHAELFSIPPAEVELKQELKLNRHRQDEVLTLINYFSPVRTLGVDIPTHQISRAYSPGVVDSISLMPVKIGDETVFVPRPSAGKVVSEPPPAGTQTAGAIEDDSVGNTPASSANQPKPEVDNNATTSDSGVEKKHRNTENNAQSNSAAVSSEETVSSDKSDPEINPSDPELTNYSAAPQETVAPNESDVESNSVLVDESSSGITDVTSTGEDTNESVLATGDSADVDNDSSVAVNDQLAESSSAEVADTIKTGLPSIRLKERDRYDPTLAGEMTDDEKRQKQEEEERRNEIAQETEQDLFTVNISNEELAKIAVNDALLIGQEADSLKRESQLLRIKAEEKDSISRELALEANQQDIPRERVKTLMLESASLYDESVRLKRQSDELARLAKVKEDESIQALAEANEIMNPGKGTTALNKKKQDETVQDQKISQPDLSAQISDSHNAESVNEDGTKTSPEPVVAASDTSRNSDNSSNKSDNETEVADAGVTRNLDSDKTAVTETGQSMETAPAALSSAEDSASQQSGELAGAADSLSKENTENASLQNDDESASESAPVLVKRDEKNTVSENDEIIKDLSHDQDAATRKTAEHKVPVTTEEARMSYSKYESKQRQSDRLADQSKLLEQRITSMPDSPLRDSLILISGVLHRESIQQWQQAQKLLAEAKQADPEIVEKMKSTANNADYKSKVSGQTEADDGTVAAKQTDSGVPGNKPVDQQEETDVAAAGATDKINAKEEEEKQTAATAKVPASSVDSVQDSNEPVAINNTGSNLTNEASKEDDSGDSEGSGPVIQKDKEQVSEETTASATERTEAPREIKLRKQTTPVMELTSGIPNGIDTTDRRYDEYVSMRNDIRRRQQETINVFAEGVNLNRQAVEAKQTELAITSQAEQETDPARADSLRREALNLRKQSEQSEKESGEKMHQAESQAVEVNNLTQELKTLEEKLVASAKEKEEAQTALAEAGEDTREVNVPYNTRVFSVSSTPVYSEKNPIPMDPGLPEGLVFKVQIGAFRKPIPHNSFRGLQPVTAETTRPGWIRYCVGFFRTFDPAKEVRNLMHKSGYRDAFVVAYYNGKRIEMNEAFAMVEKERKTNSGAYASLVRTEMEGIRKAEVTPMPTLKSFAASESDESISSATGVTGDDETPGALTKVTRAALEYAVQVGVYKTSKAPQLLHAFQPLVVENYRENLFRFISGRYDDFRSADSARGHISRNGVPDAFVVLYRDGNRVPLNSVPGGRLASPPAKESVPVASTQEVNEPKYPAPVHDESFLPVEFKVQIGAFRNNVPLETVQKFLSVSDKGITTQLDERGLHIFYAGSTASYETALQLREEIVSAGIADAFVVALRNGKRVPLTDEMKSR